MASPRITPYYWSRAASHAPVPAISVQRTAARTWGRSPRRTLRQDQKQPLDGRPRSNRPARGSRHQRPDVQADPPRGGGKPSRREQAVSSRGRRHPWAPAGRPPGRATYARRSIASHSASQRRLAAPPLPGRPSLAAPPRLKNLTPPGRSPSARTATVPNRTAVIEGSMGYAGPPARWPRP